MQNKPKKNKQSAPRRAGSSRRRTAGGRRGRGGRGGLAGFGTANQRPVALSSAPSSMGFVIPSAKFSMTGKAQALTEYAGMGDSCRVVGCDLFGSPIKAGSSDAKAGFGSTAQYYLALAPAEISTRMQNLEELFQYYAIRELQLVYSPCTATSSTVAVALGVVQDAAEMSGAISTPTQQQVMELTPSLLTPAWQCASLKYRHTGTKLWLTSGQSSPYSDLQYQADLVCTLLNGVASTVYGQLWLEYVIDFYKPSPVLNNPSKALRSREERKLAYEKERKLDSSERADEKRDSPLQPRIVAREPDFVDLTPPGSPKSVKAQPIPNGAASRSQSLKGR